ncbi:MAG TPA: HD domain-containing protein [Rickettsiales bacterium]|nr:HD domain-containing protein [Rickettsiales bacterium]
MLYNLYGHDYPVAIPDDPLLKAALTVAERAHEGQERRNSQRPYLDHVLLIYDILDKFGCSSEQKAIALLHDTVEDKLESVKELHRQLCEELEVPCTIRDDAVITSLGERKNGGRPLQDSDIDADIAELGVDKAEALSLKICQGVYQMSLGAIRFEGKRSYQVDQASRMSPLVKPIKIVDQAASVLDDIMHLPMPGSGTAADISHEAAWRETRKAIRLALKGYDVATSAADRMHRKAPLYLFQDLYGKLQELKELQKKENYDGIAALRENMANDGIEPMIKRATSYTRRFRNSADKKLPLPDIVKHFYAPDSETGIQRVTISRTTGKIVSIGVVVSPDGDDKAPANRIAHIIRDELESLRDVKIDTGNKSVQRIRVREEGVEMHSEVLHVRDFRIKPPMSPRTFLERMRTLELRQDLNVIDRELELAVMSTQPGVHRYR